VRLHSRGLAKVPGAVLLLAAALALPAAAQPRYGYQDPYAGRRYGGTQSVDGYISFEGGRCPAIRDHRSGQSYFLTGSTRELRPGDHVTLGARPVSGSTCGVRGPALQVLEIRTVWTSGNHRSAYFDARRDGDFGRFILRSRDRGGWYSDRYTYLRQGRAPQGGPYGDRGDRYDRRGQYDSPPYVPPHAGPDQDRGPSDDRGQYDRRQPQPNESYDNPDSYPDNDQGGQYDDGGYAPDQGDVQQGDIPDGNEDRNIPENRSRGNRQMITVDGTLDYDSSCPSVRGSDGKSYDLAGELGSYHDGDRVRVLGFVAGRSSCGGTALEVQEIRRR